MTTEDSTRQTRSRRSPLVEVTPDRPQPSGDHAAARAFAVSCARLMRDDKCEDVVILDLIGISPVCDFFVIATGTSDRQLRAIADHVKQLGREMGETPFTVTGYTEGSWVILDYVDVVLHAFDAEKRAYYDLDSLWGDAPKVEW